MADRGSRNPHGASSDLINCAFLCYIMTQKSHCYSFHLIVGTTTGAPYSENYFFINPPDVRDSPRKCESNAIPEQNPASVPGVSPLLVTRMDEVKGV